MDKRWVLFFLVFTAAYFILIVPAIRPSVDPDEAVEATETETVEDFAAPADPERELPTLAEPREVPPGEAPPPPEVEEAEEAVRRVAVQDAPVDDLDLRVARIRLSRRGGVPLTWEILPTESLAGVRDFDTGTTVPFQLIPQVADLSDREFPFQIEGRGLDEFNRVEYAFERVDQPDGTIELRYTSPQIEGLHIERIYRFDPESYVAQLSLSFVSDGVRARIGDEQRGWGIGWQGGFMQPVPESRLTGQTHSIAAVGDNIRTRRISVDADPVIYSRDIAWGGQAKKYFAGIIVPDPENPAESVEFSARRRNLTREYDRSGVADPMSAVLRHRGFELGADEVRTFHYHLVVGPKDYTMLRSLEGRVPMIANAPELSDIAFSQIPLGQNWLRPIALLLLVSLRWFESLVHNWGLAIILLVLVVKTILYPLSHWAIKNQAKTMAEQARLKPHLDKLNEKFKDDPQKRSQEMMKLYREHNINPLGMLRGCFPILLQMPIFFALFILLDQAVEIRGQGFLWIDDLAAPDRLIPFGFTIPLIGWNALNILPILMAITQYFTSKLMMTNITDPTQRQIMLLMPFFFTIILYNMPSGLMLYWTVQNVWQIGHTVLTKRYVAAHDSPSSGGSSPAAAPA